MNDHLVAEHRAALDLLDMGTSTTILILRNHEHLIPFGALAQCTDRNGNRLARSPDGNTDANRGPRRWRVAGTFDPRSDHGIACRRVNARVQRDDLSGDGSGGTGKYLNDFAFP